MIQYAFFCGMFGFIAYAISFFFDSEMDDKEQKETKF